MASDSSAAKKLLSEELIEERREEQRRENEQDAASICPACEQPWSEHALSIDGYSPKCLPRTPSAAYTCTSCGFATALCVCSDGPRDPETGHTTSAPSNDEAAAQGRRVTWEEVKAPGSPWPRGFRPSLSECPLTGQKCERGCGDCCRDVTDAD